jgi:hypothetical protein
MNHPKRILKEINDIKEDPEANLQLQLTEELGKQ